MGLDIRTPIGLMFLILGVLLVGYGLVTNGAEMYVRSGHNINLTWGAVLVVFGATMLLLGRRKLLSGRSEQGKPPGVRPADQ